MNEMTLPPLHRPKPTLPASHETIFPVSLSGSAREALDQCETKFYYRSIARIVSKGANADADFGRAFAKGCEVARTAYYFRGAERELAVARGVRAAWHEADALPRDWPEDEPWDGYAPPREDSPKTWENLGLILWLYLTEAYPLGADKLKPLQFGQVPTVEFNASLPLHPDLKHPESGEPLLWTIRMDMLADAFDGIWVVDDKTTSQFGESWAKGWRLDAAQIGYAWAAQQYGIKVEGTIIRGVRFRKAADWPTGSDFQEVMVPIHHWQIAEWHEQMVDDTRRAVEAFRTGRYHKSLGFACKAYGGCPYAGLCVLQDPTGFEEGYYERSRFVEAPK